MSPYEQHWASQRWEELAPRLILNGDVWARLGRAALRAGLVVAGKEQHAKEADAGSP